MLEVDRDKFSQVLSLRGRKRPYFTKNSNELRVPYRIQGTDIYMETNFDANSIVKISKDLIILFNFKEEDLTIETAD
ncbi:MAG: hypothetical protein QME14_00740 [Methanobacteriaceae archaeon]|nr:hypothetical protein [Methanobacteriaceae archaeon]